MTLGHVGEDFAPVQWLSEGWSALRRQAHDALTHFRSGEDDDETPSRWGLVATDIIDHDDRVEVRMEVPGIRGWPEGRIRKIHPAPVSFWPSAGSMMIDDRFLPSSDAS